MGKTKQSLNERNRHALASIYGRLACCVVLIVLVQAILQALVWKLLAQMGDSLLRDILYYLFNVLAVVLIVLIIGYLFYRRMRLLGEAVQKLAGGGEVHLEESGISAQLAESVNQTSDLLKEQRKTIAQRDNVRMEWIRGVSHDIRTPLSMVMGYAEMLEEDQGLTREQRSCASIIKEQSLRMRELIEDLNLTSKLEYNRQPLRLSEFHPAALLREVVSAALNAQLMQEGAEGETQTSDITLLVLPEFERFTVQADRNLIRRVFANIIGNALRHNLPGCKVLILTRRSGDRGIVEITDDGRGIPEAVARAVNACGSELGEDVDFSESGMPHIMGMRIAKQIMLAHGGNLMVAPDRHTIEIVFA